MTLFPNDEPESRYYQSGRLMLHYVVWNEGGGPTVLLVHGNREHARCWDFVARVLKDRYAVYAPDARGHGDSDWATGSAYGVAEFVLDLAILANTLPAPMTLIGYSRGGNAVLQYAAAFPDRVSKVIAIEGLGPKPIDSEAGISATRIRGWIGRMQGMERREARRYHALEDAASRIMKENPRLSVDIARHFALHGTRRNEDGSYSWKFDNYVRAGAFHPDGGQEIWAEIRAPVLLITGGESWAMDPAWQARATVIPHHRNVVIPGGSHLVHHEQLPRFLEVMEEFLAE